MVPDGTWTLKINTCCREEKSQEDMDAQDEPEHAQERHEEAEDAWNEWSKNQLQHCSHYSYPHNRGKWVRKDEFPLD